MASCFQLEIPWQELDSSEIKGGEPVSVTLDVVYLGKEKGLLFTGRISGILSPSCHRCLEEFPLPLEGEFTEEIQLDAEGVKVAQEDVDTACAQDSIDLSQLAREHVLLNLPVKFLCSQECPGICPVCGQDLAENKCGCEQDKIDPRLEKLKELLND